MLFLSIMVEWETEQKMASYEPAVNNILIIITSQIPKVSFISFYGQKMHSAGKTRKQISGDE